ncbi:MAG: protein kinase, partial [Anaerolineae bacterium]|nr:protein kinase [Anaerolineae bacterium]
MPLEQGDLLHDRYRITEVLGRGGMGAVYRAVDESLGVNVAVKENLIDDEEALRQFKREATILANMRHPNLPRVTDHFVINEAGQYLVMDFVEGEDLRQRLDRLEKLPEKEVMLIGIAICDALTYLHNLEPPILHRDIKPGNIKVTPHGHVYLVDFGLAKIVQGSQQTTTGARGLTPGFSPPEQYGSARTDARSDIYSLGATLYAVLTGEPPEDGLAIAINQTTLTKVRDRSPETGPLVSMAIEQALNIQPEERYQTAQEFKMSLLQASETVSREVASGEVTIAPPPPTSFSKSSSDLEGEEDGSDAVTATELKPTKADKKSKKRQEKKKGSWIKRLAFLIFLGAVGGGYILYSQGLIGVDDILGGVGLLPSETSAPAASPAPTETDEAVSDATQAPTAAVEATSTATEAPTATEEPSDATQQPESITPTPEELATNTPEGETAATEDPSQIPPAVDSGLNGQIAFASNRSGKVQIYIGSVNPDEKPVQVTNMENGACQPSWSPDGEQLVFISPCLGNQNSYEGTNLFIINQDGSGLTPLDTKSTAGDFAPAWDPLGEYIAFTSLRDNNRPQIYVYVLESGEVENWSNATSSDFNPSWSMDGQYLLFST